MAASHDLVVLGGGSGGVRAARIAAGLGAKVALIEEKRLGGTCVNVGCVPKKLLSYGAHAAHELEEARGFGWTIDAARHDWPTLLSNKDQEISRLNGIYRSVLDKAGVEVIDGRGIIEANDLVRVGERILRPEKLILATGGRPAWPAFPGSELAFCSDEAFTLPRLPKRLVIVGAGYIGLEFASIFSGLGVETTVLGRSARPLVRFDATIAHHVQAQMEKHGVRFLFREDVAKVERSGEALQLTTQHGAAIATDAVMVAVGRTARTEAFGALGIHLDPRGHVVAGARLETSVPGVFAVGDLVGRAELTPVALAEGQALARHLFGGGAAPSIEYASVPTAVFTLPPIGTVGASEEAARASGHVVKTFVSEFRPLKHTLSGSTERTLSKLVVDEPSDRVLGIHMAGPDAAEIIQGFAVAITCGVTKAQLDRTIGIHPTSAEELVTMR